MALNAFFSLALFCAGEMRAGRLLPDRTVIHLSKSVAIQARSEKTRHRCG
jgi:hypothetical protein